MRLRSLKNKLALVFCVMTAVVMAGTWFYVVPKLQSSLREQRRDDLARVARITVGPLERVARRSQWPRAKHLDELVRAVSDSADARRTLYGLQRSHGRPGPLWLVSDSAAQNNVDESTDMAKLAVRTGRAQKGYGQLNGATVIQTAVPIKSHGHIQWIALYSRTLDGVTETVDLIRRQLLVAGLFAALIAVFGAYLVAGY